MEGVKVHRYGPSRTMRGAGMLAVLAGSLIAGCGGSTTQRTSAPAVAPAATGATAATQAPAAAAAAPAATVAGGGGVVATTVPASTVAVPEILAFSAATVGGGTFDGAAYAGKPVAFWFWAPT